jgi:ligand-binding sensor domain-containing protein
MHKINIFFSLFFIIVLLRCSIHERDNPFDPESTTWDPPVLTTMNDTSVAVFDSFYIHASATDNKGIVEKYIWALNGETFLDTTTEGRIKAAFRKSGNQIVKVKAASSSGVISPAYQIAVNVHLYAPVVGEIKDLIAGLDDTLTITASAYDTNGTVVQYIWNRGKKSIQHSTNGNTLKVYFTSIGDDTILLKVLDDDSISSPTIKIRISIKSAVYTVSNSGLPSNNISSIATGDGSHWSGVFIGTFDMGLAYLNDKKWTVYNTANSNIPSDVISSIVIENTGDVWIGTWGGLARFDGTTWTVYSTSNSGLPDDHVTSIAVSYPEIWVGTWGGLAKFNGTAWTVYTPSNSKIPGARVSSIAIEQNIKWVGTFTGGLAKLSGTSWTIYNTGNSALPGDEIWNVTTDLYNYKWVGTRNGIGMYNGNTWRVYSSSTAGLPDNQITVIADYGSKWIGTSGHGIAILEDGANSCSKYYNMANTGLPSDNITAIARDKQNYKWVGTANGLAKFN